MYRWLLSLAAVVCLAISTGSCRTSACLQKQGYDVVDSTLFKGAKYDAGTRTLRLAFDSGDTHEYYGVSQKTYEDFLASESKGKFYHTKIKGKFKSSKL